MGSMGQNPTGGGPDEDKSETEMMEDECRNLSSCSSEELRPLVMEHFSQLSETLKQTNMNLNTFEFMLSHYRRLLQVERDKNRKLEEELHTERQKSADIRQELTGYVNRLESKMASLTDSPTVKSLSDINRQLMQQLQGETAQNAELRSRLDREKHKTLPAASGVDKMVQTQVLLEAEALEKERSPTRLHRSSVNESQDSCDQLCQTCLDNDTLDQVTEKLHLMASDIHKKVLKRSYLSESEGTANQVSKTNEKPRTQEDSELLRDQMKSVEESYANLRLKSKLLLNKYRSKKQAHADNRRKMDNIRSCLVGLKDLCQVKERNYRLILDYLGTQIYIISRLVSECLRVPCDHAAANLSSDSSLLTDWFCSIQAQSVWTQKQLMAFANTEPLASTARSHGDTISSDVSNGLEYDYGTDMGSLVAAQNRILISQQQNFDLLFASFNE